MHPLLRNAGKDLLQRGLLRGKFVWRLADDAPGIALTFDDGPHPEVTPRLLDLLAARGAHAAFFVIGENAVRYPALMRRIAEEGHVLGNHTYDHREVVGMEQVTLAEQLDRARRAIFDTAGIDSRLFRPPRGRLDFASLRKIVGLGYCVVHWSRTYSDYRRDGVDALLGRIDMQPPQPRDIVLMHDNHLDTVVAIEQALPRWQASGLRLFAQFPSQ